MKITKLSFLVFAASLLGLGRLSAQALWIGDDLADWNVTANWSGTAPVDGGTSALIFNSASSRTSVNGLSNLTASSLTVAGGSDNHLSGNAITLDGDVTVSTGAWQRTTIDMALTSGLKTFDIQSGFLFCGYDFSWATPGGGVISGDGGITKSGGGTLSFARPNTYAGGTIIDAGTLQLDYGGAAGALRGEVTIHSGATLLSKAGNSFGYNGGEKINLLAINGGTVTHESGNTLTLASVAVTMTGGTLRTTNSNGAFDFYDQSGTNTSVTTLASADSATIAGKINLRAGDNDTTGTVFDVEDGDAADDLIVNAAMANGQYQGAASIIQKSGAGRMVLSGINSFTGGAILNSGTLIVASDTALGGNNSTLTINSATGVTGAATLELVTPEGLFANTYNLTMGSNRFNTVVLDKSGDDGFADYLFGTLSLGSSTMTFNQGANVSSGAHVNIGSLNLSSGNNDRPVILNGNADITIGSASIANNALAKRLQLDGTSANNTVTGAITDGLGGARVSVVKANSGTWQLSGNNNYTGNTSVETGTLVLDQPSLHDVSMVSITSGATLDLDFAGIDVVNGLTLDGDVKSPGIYDASNTGGAITGSGQIRVLPVAFHIAGTDGTDWSDAATWQGAPPISGGSSDFVFISLSNRTSTNDLANVTASAISYPAGGRDNTLNGSQTLTLAGDVTVSTGNWQTINMPLAISGDRTFAVNAGRLYLGGVLSGTASDSITKTGAGGTLMITGTTNTFAGNVTVSAGTLSLASAFLGDATTVSINGVLDLAHGDQDTIDKLFIDGVQQPEGIYDSTTPGGKITGAGSLKVLVGPSGDSFSAWVQANITDINPAADATPGGDPDHDGADNLAEFAFHGDPLSGSDNGYRSGQATSVPSVGNALVLTFATRQGTSFTGASGTRDGVTYTAQGSTDLGSFASPVTEVIPAIVPGGWPAAGGGYEYHTFRLDASTGLAGKGFLRVKAEK